MHATPRWDVDHLQLSLQALLPGLVVDVQAEVDSTNTQLLRPEIGTATRLLVAERQTQGRGREGRPWLGAAGASLTFSLGLVLQPQRWEGLSLAVGLALAEALQTGPTPGPAPRQTPLLMLKWPNDLWLVDAPGGHASGRKLGGVLIETTQRGGQRYAVIGIGLNIKPWSITTTDTTALTHGRACLQELHADISAEQALVRVAVPLASVVRQFEAQGFAALQPRYAARDLLRGQAVTTTGAKPLQGRAEGVDEQGHLLLSDRAGHLHRVHSGEVSVRMQAQPAALQPNAA